MSKQSKNYYSALSKFMSLGLLLGTGVGFVMGDIILGLAIGLNLGFISGKVMEKVSLKAPGKSGNS